MAVYVIECSHTQTLKIGYAVDPLKRIASLQTANPYPLKLLSVIEGDRSLEKNLHAMYEPFRLIGEWFRASIKTDLLNNLAEYPEYNLEKGFDPLSPKFVKPKQALTTALESISNRTWEIFPEISKILVDKHKQQGSGFLYTYCGFWYPDLDKWLNFDKTSRELETYYFNQDSFEDTYPDLLPEYRESIYSRWAKAEQEDCCLLIFTGAIHAKNNKRLAESKFEIWRSINLMIPWSDLYEEQDKRGKILIMDINSTEKADQLKEFLKYCQ